MPRRSSSDKDVPAFDLKAERKRHKISQMEAAKILCVTQPTVARWEQSGGMPHVHRVIWNIHWKQQEQTNESETHSNVENQGNVAGRSRSNGTTNLRKSKNVGRHKFAEPVVTSAATSSRRNVARGKVVNFSSAKNNRLSMRHKHEQGSDRSARAIESGRRDIEEVQTGEGESREGLFDAIDESEENGADDL